MVPGPGMLPVSPGGSLEFRNPHRRSTGLGRSRIPAGTGAAGASGQRPRSGPRQRAAGRLALPLRHAGPDRRRRRDHRRPAARQPARHAPLDAAGELRAGHPVRGGRHARATALGRAGAGRGGGDDGGGPGHGLAAGRLGPGGARARVVRAAGLHRLRARAAHAVPAGGGGDGAVPGGCAPGAAVAGRPGHPVAAARHAADAIAGAPAGAGRRVDGRADDLGRRGPPRARCRRARAPLPQPAGHRRRRLLGDRREVPPGGRPLAAPGRAGPRRNRRPGRGPLGAAAVRLRRRNAGPAAGRPGHPRAVSQPAGAMAQPQRHRAPPDGQWRTALRRTRPVQRLLGRGARRHRRPAGAAGPAGHRDTLPGAVLAHSPPRW
jgi:hypothetical protein